MTLTELFYLFTYKTKPKNFVKVLNKDKALFNKAFRLKPWWIELLLALTKKDFCAKEKTNFLVAWHYLNKIQVKIYILFIFVTSEIMVITDKCLKRNILIICNKWLRLYSHFVFWFMLCMKEYLFEKCYNFYDCLYYIEYDYIPCKASGMALVRFSLIVWCILHGQSLCWTE